MSKLKDFLPSLFKSNKESRKTTNGRLETDAVVVEEDNANNPELPSVSNTPTVSAEMTAAVVQQLSDPNYNSMDVVSTAGAVALPTPAIVAPTTNTMNVHNAEQQLVMQISNVTGFHMGSVINFNGNIGASPSRKSSTCGGEEVGIADGVEKRQTVRKTTSVVIMMQSRDELNHRMLDTIATHLGEGWKQVMRDLGHSEGQIDQAQIDHQIHGGIKEVIYQLLLQWQRNADDGVATLGYITTLLWNTNQRDCVNRMKAVWKSDSNKTTTPR